MHRKIDIYRIEDAPSTPPCTWHPCVSVTITQTSFCEQKSSTLLSQIRFLFFFRSLHTIFAFYFAYQVARYIHFILQIWALDRLSLFPK